MGLSLGESTLTRIQEIRQTLIKEDVQWSYVSNRIWEVIFCALRDVVPTSHDFNLYTFSPDGDVCSRVWPAADENLPTDLVFRQKPADEYVEMRGSELLVHVFGGQRRRLMTASFEAPPDEGADYWEKFLAETFEPDSHDGGRSLTRKYWLEYLSQEIGAALMERRQKRALKESWDLREQLQTVNEQEHPRMLLETVIRLVFKDDEEAGKECGGELRVFCEASEEAPEAHLRLVARRGGNRTEPPLKISSATTLVRQVLETRLPAVVVGRSERYPDLEPEMTSCIKLPVFSWDGQAMGIFCVHLNRRFRFNLGMVHVAEIFLQRCAAAVERARQPDEMTRRAGKLRKMIPSAEDLKRRIDGKDWAEARRLLHSDLSRRAREMSDAFRTAVAMVGPDLTTGVGVSGTAGDWGEDFDGKIIEFDDDNSGVIEALKKGQPYLVDDVESEGARFLKVGRHPIRSTANIPISAGNVRLGVLDLEWTKPKFFDPLLIRYLTELCNVYGFVLNSVGIERHFVELEDLLKLADRDPKSSLDYPAILRIVAEILGVREGAILIRDSDTGRYYFTANLQNGRLVGDRNAYYEANETDSLTGHIIIHNRTERRLLKKDDLGSGVSGSSVPGGERPWKNKFCDNLREGQNTTAFLGAPIASGNEVFGVIRLNSDATIREFDSIDERNLTAIALRIAECLAQRVNSQRSRAKLLAAHRLLRNSGFRQVTRSIFRNIRRGVGECRAHIRLVDKQRAGAGAPLPVLARAAVSDPEFLRPTLFHLRQGTAAGRVWETESPFDDPDVRNPQSPSRGLCTDEFCAKVGSVYVVPLKAVGGHFVGTLHVYKENRHGFNDAEREFLRDFSSIVAAGMVSAAERENAGVMIKVVATQEDMLRRFMAGETFPTAQRLLLLDVMRVLMLELDCLDGWLAIPANNGFELCDNDNRRVSLPGYVEAELSRFEVDERFIGVGPEAVPGFVRELPVTLTPETQFVLLPVRVQERVLAYFLLLHCGERVIPRASVDSVRSLLGPLAEFLQLAQQVKDAQIGLPLMLLGTRASALHHKSRDPFANLKGLCERLVLEPDMAPEERKQIVHFISQKVLSLNDILKILRDLTQMATAPPAPLNVIDAIVPILDRLQREDGIDTRIQFGGCVRDEFMVMAREGYLRIAFEFLLQNARDAIRNNPTGRILVQLQRTPGRVSVEIIDNGCGMGPDVLSRALEPGFTTKKRSTGLGLPSAYSIISSHGGHLTLTSELGIGTTCQVRLTPLEARL